MNQHILFEEFSTNQSNCNEPNFYGSLASHDGYTNYIAFAHIVYRQELNSLKSEVEAMLLLSPPLPTVSVCPFSMSLEIRAKLVSSKPTLI
jgi:hypothetical protein